MHANGLMINPPVRSVSVDMAHATLLMGTVLSMKPYRVLELGYGDGYTSQAIIEALRWNDRGHLTIVDNWCDWSGEKPFTETIESLGAMVVTSDEKTYVKACPDGVYDILVSDADHQHSHEWLTDHLRIVRPGGVLFFHDVGTYTDFPNLQSIPRQLNALGVPFKLFETSTRPDERCGRGWLMAFKPGER